MNRKLENRELGRPSAEDAKNSNRQNLILVLDNLRSMHNVGSIFRTADAFACKSIFLCGITPQPPHREIQKTALGATDSVPWEYFKSTKDALSKCKEMGFSCWSAEQTQNSIPPGSVPANFFSTGIALVLGSEVGGVHQDIVNTCEGCIEIPQQGSKHSLNVAVAAGILCWEMTRKLKL